MKSFRSKCYYWLLALFEDNYGNDDSYCDISLLYLKCRIIYRKQVYFRGFSVVCYERG